MTDWRVECADCDWTSDPTDRHIDACQQSADHRIRYNHDTEIVEADEVAK